MVAAFRPDPRVDGSDGKICNGDSQQLDPARDPQAAAGAAGASAASLKVDAIAWRKSLDFFLNGKRFTLDDVQPHHTLLSVLRDRLGLTGTKLGCGEGGCGACTVDVAHWDATKQAVVYRAVNACLAPVCSVDGCAVTTVEGLGTAQEPHEVQTRIAECHGSQCGFCTPGIVMSLYSALRRNPEPTLSDIESTFDGNLCRCTGYRPILDAAKTFACDQHKCPPSPEGYTGADGKPESEGSVRICGSTAATLAAWKGKEACRGKAAGEGPEFPEALKSATPAAPLRLAGDRVTWYAPTDLAQLLALKQAYPKAKIVAGNTEVGIETKFKNMEYPVTVFTGGVGELQQLGFDGDGALVVGGSVTLAALEHFLEHSVEARPLENTQRLKAILDMLHWFASGQIRSVAVLAGNVATASPISDLNPVLMALGASLTLGASGAAPREVLVTDFFKSYRVVDMQPHEVICSVRVPAPTMPYEFVRSFKQAKRRDDDISIVNACLRVELAPGPEGWRVAACQSGYGGMAPTTVRAKRAEAALVGALWGPQALEAARAALAEDLPLPEAVPGGMAAYRQTLAASFLHKFYVAVSLQLADLAGEGLPAAPAITASEASAAENFLSADRPLTHGTQCYEVPSGGLQQTASAAGEDHAPLVEENRAPVGQPIRHISALHQCTGEAKYVDDIPDGRGCLHSAFVLSEKPHARLVSVDASAALAEPGVVRFFSAKDVSQDQNLWGPILQDEEVFRRDTVTSTGQPIGLLVAETLELAQRAARLVKVQYEDLPPVLTIDDAIKAEAFHPWVRRLENDGDVDGAFGLPDSVVVEGEFRVGGQEHFYLETNCCYVEPGEQDELTVYSSTQNPMKAQKFAAKLCGLPFAKVNCRMKRMGGGFGGKETRTVFISSAVALAAHRLQRPVRMNVERDIDMWITGTRHPFVGKYRAAAGPDGKVRALDLRLYCNAGYSLDLSEPIIGRALFHSDNVYRIPSFRAVGYMCMTNTTSNSAYRGFGGPQGLIVCEAWMDHLATALRMPAHRLRELNLYAPEGDRTSFNQLLERNPTPRLVRELVASSDFARRLQEVQSFNEGSRWRKRGIAMLPTKFGISFTAKFMNQAGALVHVYTDGSVLVSHGGTEMGQGLHTKIAQVAARAFGIPFEDVTIKETNTDMVPNSSPTAASASSDLYGMAVLSAAEQIKGRLKPYLEKHSGNWKEAVHAAFFDRCDLSAHGFYKTPGIGYDWNNPDFKARGTPFAYFTFGAACTEVEIDVLTGDLRMRRADILMDLGNSLNPAIDVGQIEGAFTQGVGWTTMEETVWGCDEFPWLKPGACFTRGPGTYKIPSFNDVPVDMRVTLLRDSANPRAIHSSRAVGEPPFFLGASVFFAARMAIASARADAGCGEGHFAVQSPLTAERIRMACGDEISAKFAACGGRGRPSGFV